MKNFVFISFILFTTFLSCETLDGQVHYRFFYGKILTSDNQKPLANVNISFQGSKLGTVSENNGSFSFYIDTLPVIMVVSHLGYKTKKILLDGTSTSMTLYMDKEIRELKEIDIKANIIEAIFKCDHYELRDYEIDSGLVYLLVYHSRVSKEELICRNLEGDTIARSGILLFTPISLFKDCLGNLQIIGSDSVYQVSRIGKNIHLYHPESLTKFNDLLSNCVASTTQFLYFKKAISLGQGIIFYGINRISKEKRILSKVADEDKLKMLRLNFRDAGYLSTVLPGGRSVDQSMLLSGLSTSLFMDRDAFDEWNWVHKVVYRPIKSMVYRIGNFICVFDIPKKDVEFYDQDGNFSLKLKLNIDIIKDGEWSGDIYLDEAQSKVYTTFLRNSGPRLYRIDLNTGDLHKILTIKHPYPQKIKIYKDKIYYLYDVLGYPEDKTLYRQNL